MRRHRGDLAVLVGVLALFFNLERLDVGSYTANIDTFVYVLVTTLVMTSLAYPRLTRLRTPLFILVWVGFYAVGNALFSARSFLGGFDTYLTISELSFIAIVAAMTHRLGGGVTEFEEVVCTLTLGRTEESVRSVEAAADEVRRAVLLSRRNERSLAVLVVEPVTSSDLSSADRVIENLQRSMLHRFMVNTASNVVADAVRRTDIALQKADDGRLVVVCPETDEKTAQTVVQHIQDALSEKLGWRARFGLANFPGDAFTFEELVERAEARVRDQSSSHKGSAQDVAVTERYNTTIAHHEEKAS